MNLGNRNLVNLLLELTVHLHLQDSHCNTLVNEFNINSKIFLLAKMSKTKSSVKYYLREILAEGDNTVSPSVINLKACCYRCLCRDTHFFRRPGQIVFMFPPINSLSTRSIFLRSQISLCTYENGGI